MVVVVGDGEGLPQHWMVVVSVEGLSRHRHCQLPQNLNHSWFFIGSLSLSISFLLLVLFLKSKLNSHTLQVLLVP